MLVLVDVVLVAPSAKGFQTLLHACTCFAASHGIVFNTCRSQALVVLVVMRPLRIFVLDFVTLLSALLISINALVILLLVICMMMLTFLDKHDCCTTELTGSCVSFLRPKALLRSHCSMPSAALFMAVICGIIFLKNLFVAYMLPSVMPYGFAENAHLV